MTTNTYAADQVASFMRAYIVSKLPQRMLDRGLSPPKSLFKKVRRDYESTVPEEIRSLVEKLENEEEYP